MQNKGQGALEYLLLIGGAVLIAVIVIAVVTGMANTTGPNVGLSAKCATASGCQACLRIAGCAGMAANGTTQVFVSSGGATDTCTTAQITSFAKCKVA